MELRSQKQKSKSGREVKQMTIVLEQLNATVLAKLRDQKYIDYPLKHNFGGCDLVCVIAGGNSSADTNARNRNEVRFMKLNVH